MKNNILLIAILLLTFSCKKQNEASKVIEKAENVEEVILKPKNLFTKTVREHLSAGIWVSEQYDSLLKATHSLTSADKKLQTYSDIIYNGDNILHCNYPYYQEELQFKIFDDLSVGYLKNDIDFKITNINENRMTIKNKNGNFNYYKIEKDIEKSKIFIQVTQGSSIQQKRWFSGSYTLTLNDKTHDIFINENGKVIGESGESPYAECEMYTWYEDETKKEYDVIVFKTPFEEENFMVELATDEAYHLQKINTFDGVGETAVLQNSTAILKKDTEEIDYEEREEDNNAISLDELADENYTEPTQSEMNAYVAEKLTPDNNGVYNLGSLQKIYQDRFPESKFITIENTIATFNEEFEDEPEDKDDFSEVNLNYFNSGGIINKYKKSIVIPKDKIFYTFISDKNKNFQQLAYERKFYKIVLNPNETSLFDDDRVKFINGKQVFKDYKTHEFNPVFNEEMKTGENYLVYVKLETEKGNTFYSDVLKIKYIKDYDYSELEKLEVDGMHQFETEETQIKEYVFDKNGDKQVLQLVFVDYDSFLFKITANTQTCDNTIFGKTIDTFHNETEYYVENKSEIKKILFNKEKTKVKIVMHDDVSNNDCQIIEEVMELVKE